MRKSWPIRTAVAVVTLLMLAAGALRAQTSFDTTFAVRPNARLSVQNMTGTINIRGWNRAQMRVQADFERAHVDVQVSGNQMVSVKSESRRGNAEVEYNITVPQGTAVDINGLSVDVGISGVCGALSINSTSGDIDATCLDGDTQIQTISGDITIADARGTLDVSSTSGDIEVRGARSSVTAHAVSGNVSLSEVAGSEVDVETVAGDVEYSGRIADNGRYRFAAHSGDVTVRIQGNPNATVAVSTFSGDFTSDFQIELQPGTRVGKEWEFRLGSGSARMRVNSFSGTINLQRGTGGNSREE
jgi:DUF4097 and DUF4098 domain-containing protein YvlB